MDDGSIVIGTMIDTSGIADGTEKLKAMLDNLKKQFATLSNQIDIAFRSNGTASIESLMGNFEALKGVLEKTQEVVAGFTGNEGFGFDELMFRDTKFATQMDGLNKELEILLQNIEEYKDIQEQINGTQTDDGATEKASNENQAQERLNDTLREQIVLRQANNNESGGEGGNLWTSLLAGFKGVMSGIGKLVSGLFKSRGSDSIFGKMLKPLTSFGGMLKRMILRRIMMAIINGVREGMQNLAKYSKQVEANLTTLKSALGQLKNSFATAFAPILSAVTPALATLINYLSQAITMVAQFFSALGGSTTFIRAKAYTDEFSSSVGGASKATKELEKQLAGFDELEILSANKGGGGGGGGGGIDPSEMFETVNISQSVLDMTQALRDAIAKGDFQAIGEELGNLFNKGVASINWSDFGKKVATGLNNAVKLVNGFLITADFEALGRGLMQFINSGISTFDFRTLGSAISGVIKSALNFIAGLTDDGGISTLVTNIFNAVIDFIKGFDLGGIISAITTILTNIITDLPSIILSILQGVGNLFVTVSQALFGAIFTVPDGYFEEFDAVQEKVDTVLGNIQESAQTHMSTIGTIMGDAQVARDYVDALEKLNEKEHLSVEDKAEMERLVALLNEKYPDLNLELDEETGHLNMTNDELHTYIDNQEKILLLEATRARQSQIIEQLTEIYGQQREVVEKLKEKEQELANNKQLQQSYRDIIRLSQEGQTETDKLGNQFRLTKEQAEKYKPILDQLGINYTEINGELVFSNDEIGKLNDAIQTQQTVIDNTSAKCDEYRTDLANLEGSASDLSTEYDELNKVIKDGGNVVDYYKGKINGVTKGINDFIKEGKKVNTKDIGENIVKGIGAGIDAQQDALLKKAKNLTAKITRDIKNGLKISSPSKVMEDEVGKWIPLGIAEGIEDTTPKALKTMDNLAESIADEIDSQTYSAQILPEAQLTGFADTIVDGFVALGDKLQSIAERIAYTVPSVANGLMPYSVGITSQSNANLDMQRFLSSALVNATNQIVSAINSNGDTNITIDSESLSDTIISNINKRTRQLNTSPLVV